MDRHTARLASDFTVALVRGLRDSADTEALLQGEEISSVWRMPAVIEILEAHPEGRDILRDRPQITSQTVDFDALRRLPSDRLGHRYIAHLDRNGLDPDALTTPVTRHPDPLANYVLERIRQTHDVWHALLGLGTTGHEEVLVHAFQWPQLRMPYSALVLFFGVIKHYLGEARWELLRQGTIREAARAGLAARPLIPVYWERYFDEPVVALQARFDIVSAERWRGYRPMPREARP